MRLGRLCAALHLPKDKPAHQQEHHDRCENERTVAAGAQMRFANDAAEIESGHASSAFIRTLSLSTPASAIERSIPNSIPNPISKIIRTEPSISILRVPDVCVGPGIETQIAGAKEWRRRNRVLNPFSALDLDRAGDANR